MYTTERKDRDQSGAVWQLIEGSWETPNCFELPEVTESVTRAMALRNDSRIGTSILPLLSEQLAIFTETTRHLEQARSDDGTEAASEQVARCDRAIDMALQDIRQVQEQVHNVLGDVVVLLSSPEAQDLALTLALLTKCLVDWLELDEGCTCAGSSLEEPCLTCSSQSAQAQAKRWLHLLEPGQTTGGKDLKTAQALTSNTTEKEIGE